MDTANKVCWYLFLTYLGVVLVGGAYVWITDIFGGNIGGLAHHGGRADMYDDFDL